MELRKKHMGSDHHDMATTTTTKATITSNISTVTCRIKSHRKVSHNVYQIEKSDR
uniref:Uncharacterized protein n=1 Tax=Arion vulgaris TaxID=1028688 RepID=A0A0B7AIZ7_9EUPU